MSRTLGGLCLLLCAISVRGEEPPLPPAPIPVQPADALPPPQPVAREARVGPPSDEEPREAEELLGLIAFAPFTYPHLLLNDDLRRKGYFPSAPYADNHFGYMHFEEGAEEAGFRRRAGRFSLEFGHNFDDIGRLGFDLRTETASRFGFRIRIDDFYDQSKCGCLDDFNLGTFDVTYRFAQSERLQMYAGVGLRNIDTSASSHYGYNFTYGADVYPVRPVILSLQMDGGAVDGVGIFRARGTAGVIWRRYELFTGYDYLHIGGFDLHSLLAGVRVWY
jgi:hypothetical protein